MVGNLIQVEMKRVMKSRVGRSPDFADTDVVMGELFRKLEGPKRKDGWSTITGARTTLAASAQERDVSNDPEIILATAD